MSNRASREYIELLKLRYHRARKKERTVMLDELCKTYAYSRKYAVRLLGGAYTHRTGKRGRKPYYTGELVCLLEKIWKSLGYMNMKNFKEALPEWMPYLQEDFPMDWSTKEKLLKMSASTMDRFLKPYRAKIGRSARSGTRRFPKATKYEDIIPIRDFKIQIEKPGHLQADTVAHCGGSMRGEFIWTLTVTDIKTGWTENRAIWNKLGVETTQALKSIKEVLPFEAVACNVDNGSEFINHHFLNTFGFDPEYKLDLSKSRAAKKNDNCYVEQKNWTHVRKVLGYERFDSPLAIKLLNSLYENELSLLRNFFIPQVRTIEKVRVGSKYKRKYDTPQTPYERVMKFADITTRERLRKIKERLNPIELSQRIEDKLNVLFKLYLPSGDKKNKAA